MWICRELNRSKYYLVNIKCAHAMHIVSYFTRICEPLTYKCNFRSVLRKYIKIEMQ